MAPTHDTATTEAMYMFDGAPESAPAAPRRPPGQNIGTLGDLLQLGFVAQLCLAAFDLEQALQLACRFSPLWSRCSFHYERTDADVLVRARDFSGHAEHDFDPVDLALTWSILARRVSGGAAAARAVDAPREQRPRLCRLLDCPIREAEGELAVRFATEDVQHRNPQHDPSLVRVLTAHGEQCIAALVPTASTRARARHALGRISASGAAVRLDSLARELGLSTRTLHRRLHAEGTSFRALAAEHKLELSLEQLESPKTSAKQVAFELGFADPASFHRAFKRWTGHTVSQHRELQAQKPEASP